MRKLSILSLLAFSTPLFAQGADLCASAQVIAGAGTFAFDCTTATTDGVPDALCNFSSQSDIQRDVWFAWTPAVTATYTIDTCGQTTLDSKIAVLDGSCAGVVLACDDDACAVGLQTSLSVNVIGGNLYYLRVGRYPNGGAGGTGTFTIVAQLPPAVVDTRVNPANGRTYHLLSTGSWTDSEQVAVSLGGHLATVDDQAEHDWISAQWHTIGPVNVHLWIGLNDVASEGTWVWVDGTPVSFLNWAAGEPNDGGTGEDYVVMRRFDAPAQWNDLQNVPTDVNWLVPQAVVEIADPGTPYCFGDGSGAACPCTPVPLVGDADKGCPNSFNAGGGKLDATGIASISSDSLLMTCTTINNGGAVVFQGTNDNGGGLGTSFGDGLRCAAGTVRRMRSHTVTTNTHVYPDPMFGDNAISIRGAVFAPGDRFYQGWYRSGLAHCNPTQNYNLTNAVKVTWVL